MKAKKLLPVFVCVMLALAAFTVAFAADPPGTYKLLTTISIPGGLSGFDISWVDASNARYYLADRGNAKASPPIAPRIDVIDTEHNQYLTSIMGVAGSNGVVAIPRAHELWVGDNDSTVKVISTDTYAITHTINTGGKARADEIAYDPVDHLILVANDRDAPPFVSFISQQTYTVTKMLNYDGVSAPQSTGGIEQPVWDGAAGKFYLAIPKTTANPSGEVDELDPQQMIVTRSFPTTCGPAGLVLIPSQRLMTSCGDVIDVATGLVLDTIRGVGGDEIWFNPGDDRVYFGGGTNFVSVNVVDTDSNVPVTTLVAGQFNPPTVIQTTHSVAADSDNNQIFVPVSGVGVQVWTGGGIGNRGSGAFIGANPNPIPTNATAVTGMTTIRWNAPDSPSTEIHVGAPDGPLFAAGLNVGTAQTGMWVTDGMTFYLQDVTGGKPLTSANTLATVVVHLKRM